MKKKWPNRITLLNKKNYEQIKMLIGEVRISSEGGKEKWKKGASLENKKTLLPVLVQSFFE